MEQRVPSEQEAKYINKAYGVNDIFARYLLNLFIILFLVIIVVLFCASLNQTDAVAQAFSKAGGMLGILDSRPNMTRLVPLFQALHISLPVC